MKRAGTEEGNVELPKVPDLASASVYVTLRTSVISGEDFRYVSIYHINTFAHAANGAHGMRGCGHRSRDRKTWMPE